MWALEWENQVLVVDAGLMFPQDEMLGIDLVLPDISYRREKGRKVLGIFVSHGHEDQMGGLPVALKKLNVPVYGTRLTLGLVKPKLKEHRILRESDLREVRVGDTVQLGPFRVETVAVCHSIPDAVALAIQTPVGRVIYTSDFKLDPDPPDGHPTHIERFRRLGDDGSLRLFLAPAARGERMSALASLAAQRRPAVNVVRGDWVVISARPIPGNERSVPQTVNTLSRHGAHVFYSEVGHVHVTGHAQKDELREMIDAVRPRYFIPVHGEYRQLYQHADIAREAGIDGDRIGVIQDGPTVDRDPGTMRRERNAH